MGYRENKARASEMERSMTLQTAEPLESGFADSFSLAAEQFKAEDLTTSEDKAVTRFYGDRNAELDRMIDGVEIPPEIAEQYRNQVGMNEINGLPQYEPDYHALAGWSNEHLATEFDTDDTEMRQVMASERRERERRLSNGSMVGGFAGSMWGSLHDPAILAATVATFPITYGAGGSATSLVLRTAMVEGLIGATSEVPIQLDVMAFKERIDSPYTVDDAIKNVLAAGAGSAVLSGAGAALGRALELRFKSQGGDLAPEEAFEEVVRAELSTNRPDVPRFEVPEMEDEFTPFREMDFDGRSFDDIAQEVDAVEDAMDDKLRAFVSCMEA